VPAAVASAGAYGRLRAKRDAATANEAPPSTAVARHSRRGWRIDKPNPRANIDAVIALCMAVERAEFKPEPVELLGWLWRLSRSS
jgi:hypothetical protein